MLLLLYVRTLYYLPIDKLAIMWYNEGIREVFLMRKLAVIFLITLLVPLSGFSSFILYDCFVAPILAEKKEATLEQERIVAEEKERVAEEKARQKRIKEAKELVLAMEIAAADSATVAENIEVISSSTSGEADLEGIDISGIGTYEVVDVRKAFPTINVQPALAEVELSHKTPDGRVVGSARTTYETELLRKATAVKLNNANMILMGETGMRIRLVQGFRTAQCQGFLREHFILSAPAELQSQIRTYIASPGNSYHQKGMAVDIELEDVSTGELLSMPTSYLAFTPLASAYPSQKNVTPEVMARLKKLQEVMVAAGFEIYAGEWWHFNDIESLPHSDVLPDSIMAPYGQAG